MSGTPKVSFTFPLRWLNDPEDRKYLGQNLVNSIRKGGLKQIYQVSPADPYFQQFGNSFINSYAVVLKYHAYQPIKVKLTAKQLEPLLKPFFNEARLASYQTFFVQTNNPTALPVLEMEIYY